MGKNDRYSLRVLFSDNTDQVIVFKTAKKMLDYMKENNIEVLAEFLTIYGFEKSNQKSIRPIT